MSGRVSSPTTAPATSCVRSACKRHPSATATTPSTTSTPAITHRWLCPAPAVAIGRDYSRGAWTGERRLSSGKQVGDADAGTWQRQRRHGGLGAERHERSVTPAERDVRVGNRPAVHLEEAIHQVHDPVVGEAGPGIEATLVLAVQREARLAGFDHEHGA